MICRVCTLTENAEGKPRKNQFAVDLSHISDVGDGFFVCYRQRRRHARGHFYHRHAYLLWRHSPSLYAVFTRGTRRDELTAAPMNGLRLRAYCNQATHGWRVYSASGTDSAIDPMTGNPVVAFTDRIVTLSAQPPATVSVSNPMLDPAYPTLTMTTIVPTLPSTLGTIDMIVTARRNTDADDDATELEDD